MFRCDTFEVYNAPAYKTQLNISGKSTLMEIDTGASLSVVSDKTFKALCQGSEKLSLHDTTITLPTFSGDLIEPQGVTEVPVFSPDDQEFRMPLVVVRGDQPSLLGRDWLGTLKLDWRNVRKLTHVPQLDALLSQYSDLFKDELGEMN